MNVFASCRKWLYASTLVLIFHSCLYAMDAELEKCKNCLETMDTWLIGRTIRYETTATQAVSKQRLSFEDIEDLESNDQRGGIGEVTKWTNDYAIKFSDIAENKKGVRFEVGYVRRGDKNLQVDYTNQHIMMLKGRDFFEAPTEPLFGIFQVPGGPKQVPMFSKWAKEIQWNVNVTENKRILSAVFAEETIQLRFDITESPKLELVAIDGKCNNENKGFEGTEIEFKLRMIFEYDTKFRATPDKANFPTSIQSSIQTRVEERDSHNKSHLFVRKTKILSIGEPVPRFSRWGDVVKGINNGTNVSVDDHAGIEFEWRDGDIVRVIDRKKLDDINGLQFRGSKWTIPIAVCVVACLGATGFWWFRR